MAPYETMAGSIGPPIRLKRELEKVNKGRAKFTKGLINAEQLEQLQESAEEVADKYGIYLMWLDNHAALYGRCNGIYWLTKGPVSERPRSK